MKILIVIHSLASGGAERVAVNQANYWADNGHDVTVVTMDDQDADFFALDSRVQRIALGLSRASPHVFGALAANWTRLIRLRRLLLSLRPDVALGMMTLANVLLAIAGKGLGIPCIGSEHTHPPMIPLGFVWEHLRKITYGMLDAIVVLTPESAEWVKTNTAAKSVIVIPNASPFPLPDLAPRIDPHTVGRAHGKRLLAVGRLVPEKGFDLLLDAFSRVRQAHAGWDLVIVGEGPEREALMRRIEQSGLLGRVFMPGNMGNMGDWYNSADLYVMSSRFEGFGNTLAEALSHGVAAVSVDCLCGPRHILRHEMDGLLVPSGDVQALASALAWLMSDDSLRQSFAARAIEARERFSPASVSGQWEALFQKVCRSS